jgi:hypothetical protein
MTFLEETFPYSVITVGVLALVGLWLVIKNDWSKNLGRYEEDADGGRERMRAKQRSSLLQALAFSIVILVAMWFFGVKGIERAKEADAADRAWIASYVDEHKENWDVGCDSFFTRNFGNGVLYANGKPYTTQWCKDQWSPPKVPTDPNGLSPYDAPPHAVEAIFEGKEKYCQVPSEDYECITIDDLMMDPPEYVPDPPDTWGIGTLN